ncbi:MAG: transcription-repair coupling factor [Clostridia bacterium]|nr:transcription-repair coupling factor [Clostridia bacterium]
MEILKQIFDLDRNFRTTVEFLGKEKATALVTGVCDGARAPFCAALTDKLNRKPLFIVPDEKSAHSLKTTLSPYYERVLIYTARDMVFNTVETYSKEWEQERLDALSRIAANDYDAVITVPDALMQYTIPLEVLKENSISIKRGSVLQLKEVADKLTAMGYRRADLVEGAGQFSVRGGILDVFTAGEMYPCRIDFFGDEVDLIGHFDVLDQRRIDNIDEFSIVPSTELICSENAKKRIIDFISKKLNSDETDSPKTYETLNREREALLEQGRLLCPDKYYSFLYENKENLFNYMQGALPIIFDSGRVLERARAYYWEYTQNVEGLVRSGLTNFASAESVISDSTLVTLLSKNAVVLNAFFSAKNPIGCKIHFNIDTKHTIAATANTNAFIEDVEAYLDLKHTVLAITTNSRTRDNLSFVLAERGIKSYPFDGEFFDNAVAIAVLENASLYGGFELPKASFVMLNDSDTARSKVARKGKLIMGAGKRGEKIASFADLSVGDYVVHINHGIGKYEGIKNLITEGVSKDYIKLSYAAGDALYVPCNQLDTISKYIGGNENVKLTRLGTSEWQRAKQKAKSSAKDIAKDLMLLYGQRMKNIGFAFPPDSELQDEFESLFEYPETEGQLIATEEIKRDMQKEMPMDRLLCGDVGFGKTEVALRAAFKAFESGKQVAILVPTTILAWQHYQTVLNRFKGFGAKIAMLSRFHDKKTLDSIKTDLSLGKIDIVVGTHKLLQKDIKFFDLGLLIIDEEQRFGVTHKEKLKTLAKDVDTLTLSATPIPRTLNMVLSGIRDMSVLEDAPVDRIPVQSYVLEYDEEIVFEAIRKELRRGGQVFYLHNDIESIYSRAYKISEQFPDRTVAIAHGKLDKDELSQIWESLVNGETDILVCTTIIETGVDVPNANTLIIEDANRLGLSQLHQIRGRVGRSPRKAYAYFTYRQGTLLSEIATKRLEAVKEYTEFGSGFKIAMRDLEIRGAGDVLGAEQHGHIQTVGYDLYIKLLEEAVNEEKGIFKPNKADCSIDISVNAFIPESYIESSNIRIDIYKKIAVIENTEERDDLVDELIDRFGDIPQSVSNLIDVSLIRNSAAVVGFKSIEQRAELISFYKDELDIKVCTEIAATPELRGLIMISAGAKPHISCRVKKGNRPLELIRKIVELYANLSQKE